MATLAPSFAIRSSCFSCGAMESSSSSKLCATSASHYVRKLKITPRSGRLDTEKKLCAEVSQNVARTRGDISVYASSSISVDGNEHVLTLSTKVDELQKVSTYLFRTDLGGLVSVSVRKNNVRYVVNIDVSSLQTYSVGNKLELAWGVYGPDSASYMHLDSQYFTADAKTGIFETPFTQNSSGTFVIDLEFEAKRTPFYLSFLLKSPLGDSSSDFVIRSHLKAKFCVPVGFGAGLPAPLGLSFSTDGSINFAIFSRNAEGVVLCLYNDAIDKPALELDLDPYVNRSGDVWHASVGGAWNFVSYGYRFKGDFNRKDGYKSHLESVLLDPYSKIIVNSIANHQDLGIPPKYLGRLCKEPDFDWGGDVRLNLPMEKLVVYRLNVMRFTEHKSSMLPTEIAGTFSGVTEKVHHLKDLGVNVVLLEPIFSFDEQKGPYFPLHFFSPMDLYGLSRGSISAINSMKELVKKLHANGIEVLLEVVFTQTVDGALQGIDDSSYYYLQGGEDIETRNALNCNHPAVQQMILNSLRHWVTEFHIDGFCFINASSMLRGTDGENLPRPPLIEAISFDPLLSKAKVIADFWDSNDLAVAAEETRFPHWKRWAEVNTNFCNDVRNFWRGEGLLSELATRLCGSGDVFSDGRGPAFSFNFISRNSGLPLVDLVSFSSGGLASELSWNCGEGPTTKTAVLVRRLKQIRNFLFVLYVSLGVPILNMGDECGQSSGGSTLYSDRKPFNWSALTTSFGIQTTAFISFLSSFKQKRSDLLQQRNFLKEENIDWHGSNQSTPRWEDPECKFLAMRLKVDKEESQSSSELPQTKGDLYMAFNAAGDSEIVVLPPPSEGMTWHRLVDTALSFPGFFSTEGEPVIEQMDGLYTYEMEPHSCTLFEESRKKQLKSC